MKIVMKLRKFCIFSLLVLTAVNLTAGPGQEKNDAAGTGKVVELTMWYQENKTMIPGFLQRVEDFNEAYKGKYHLSIEFIPRGTAYAYEDKVNSAAFTNSLPDLLALDGPNVSNYAFSGIIIPIDEYVTPENKADMMPSMVLQNTYNGRMYAIGLNEASNALYYNKDVFAAHGFRIPKNIKDAYTWDELYQMAKKISTPKMVGIKIIMNKGEGLPYVLTPFWDANGASFTSEDGSKCGGYINSPKGVETAQYFQRFFLEKLTNIDPSPTEFQDGKAAMWFGNPGEMSNFTNNFPDLQWGVTYVPIAPTGVSASACGSWTLGISRDVKNLEAAAATLLFMTNAESNRVYSDLGSYPPARRSNYENNPKWSTGPGKVFADQLFENAMPRPRTPVYTVLSPKFSETILDVFRGADAKTSLDALAKYVDDEYARFLRSSKR
jgi:fructooligosaccharide transport system substrate-binding protein